MFNSKKFKREVKEKQTIPKARNNKLMRKVLWFLIVCVALSGVLAFMKAGTAINQNKELSKEMAQLESKTKTNDSPAYDPSLEIYLNGFVQAYMNVPNTPELFQARTETLNNFYAKGIEPETFANQNTRLLKSFDLYRLEEIDGVKVAQYIVAYENVAAATATVTSQLNIPYEEKNGAFSVVDDPYFTTVTSNMTDLPSVKQDVAGLEEVTYSVASEVEVFLQEFFTKYADSGVEDMAYMMNEPEALGGVYVFESSTQEMYMDGKTVCVFADVVFREKASDVKHTESMTLELVKKDGKYYVDKLTHSKGGK